MTVETNGRRWVLRSGNAAYAFGVEPQGLLVHSHWGAALSRFDDYPEPRRGGFAAAEHAVQNTPQEVTTGEAGDSNERTLDAISADGRLRGFVLRFQRADTGDDRVAIELADAAQGVTVTARYRTLDRFGLFQRELSIRNDGKTPLKLSRVFSGALPLPSLGEFSLTSLDGRWGDEFRRQRQPIAFGTFSRESRRLATSHRSMPFFAVDRNGAAGAAGEEHGELWFGTLAWSGNWKLIAERTRGDRTIIHLGLNDHDFAWDLEPGESFEAPRLVFGYTSGGFGAMSRAFHDFIREDVSPRPHYVPPVVYNSWFATLFDVNERGQTALARKAAAMGVEMFVLDDGWFSGRQGDDAGLGDWWPDKTKFPDGLNPLIAEVNRLGMKFGLWIEPEMVNPNSDLYRSHPDWIIHFPRRDRTLSRNQSILNLGRADVQAYIIGVIDRLLGEQPIDFIKWDMNRNVSEPGWPDHPRDERELWVRYVHGLYHVWGELRRRHPDVIWEGCAAGGGRVDLGMAALTEQTWISDNTAPAARLQIQEGYGLLFPANSMACWVTDPAKSDLTDHGAGDRALRFRFHVAMAGALGVGGNLAAWSERQCEEAARHVATYKKIRPLIGSGDLHRLVSPHDGSFSVFMHVAKDKAAAVLFAFRTLVARKTTNPVVRLAGLEPARLYALEGSNGAMSGAALMHIGVELGLGNFDSCIVPIKRLE